MYRKSQNEHNLAFPLIVFCFGCTGQEKTGIYNNVVCFVFLDTELVRSHVTLFSVIQHLSKHFNVMY